MHGIMPIFSTVQGGPKMSMKLPSDFAKKIADTFNWKLAVVEDFFEFSEDKEGFFWCKLKPKKFLDKPDFVALCKLTKDLGGEDYLQGARAWKVPSAYAKKSGITPQASSTPATATTANTANTGVTPNVIKDDKSRPNIRNISFIPVASISVPAFLPTREIVDSGRHSEIRDSIKKHGLEYPIKIRPGSEARTYELIDGFLRLQSVKELGWKEIPAEIKTTSDQELVIQSIITNKDRVEEDPITMAKKLDILVNAFGYTQEKLAQELGVSRPWISNTIRFLKLPKEIQHYLALNNVTYYHGLLLLTLEKPDLQVQLAREVVDKGLSTRQLEERIQEVQPKPGTPIKAPPIATLNPQDMTVGKAKELLDTPAGKEVLEIAVKEKLAEGPAEEASENEDEEGPLYAEHIKMIDEEPQTDPSKSASNEIKVKEGTSYDVAEFTCKICNEIFMIRHLSSGKHSFILQRKDKT
jgi:ParB family chromosome partitioning protein